MKGQTLTKDEKVEYMTAALALNGYAVTEKTVELIIDTYEGIRLKGEDFALRDVAKIRAAVEKKYPAKTKSE